MAQVELIMPKMGESIIEATILKWLKKEGDKVSVDESVLEIATDKVDSEVPSPVEGTVTKVFYEEGNTVEVGKVIALISTNGALELQDSRENSSETPAPPATSAQPATTTAPQPSAKTDDAPAPEVSSRGSEGRFYSPLVLNIARQEKISMEELESISGSGSGGRVTKHDILNFVQNRGKKQEKPQPQQYQSQEAPQQKPQQTISYSGDNVEIIEMDRMRKLIRDHMTKSKHTAAHVTSFVEADVTSMVKWRDKVKKDFEKREGEKITFTPLFIEAIVKAIKDFPMINSSVDGDRIIVKKDINIGMAAALPNNNLIVPVIRNADHLSLAGLTKKVNDLAGRARENKLKPEDIDGGTFTISNVGTFGNLMGTPIINQPQVAIMATGAIKKKPVVIETELGDTIAIRHMMFLSLTYDHRIVDGFLGGSFLRKVADYLEQFDLNRGF